MKSNTIKSDLVYLFMNYFVAYIPFWNIRKLLYRTAGMKIGKNSRIAMKCIVMSPSKISIGANSIINEYCLLDGRGELEIGNNNSVSMFTKLYTCSHLSNSSCFDTFCKKIIIKNNCWLGSSCVVLPGSILNDFVIIGANSLFKGKSIKRGIYVGNPSSFIKKRQIDNIYNIRYKSWFR